MLSAAHKLFEQLALVLGDDGRSKRMFNSIKRFREILSECESQQEHGINAEGASNRADSVYGELGDSLLEHRDDVGGVVADLGRDLFLAPSRFVDLDSQELSDSHF